MENCQGRCPKCKSFDVEYTYTDDYSSDGRVYSFTCQECGCEAHEHYELRYVETIIDEEYEKSLNKSVMDKMRRGVKGGCGCNICKRGD